MKSIFNAGRLFRVLKNKTAVKHSYGQYGETTVCVLWEREKGGERERGVIGNHSGLNTAAHSPKLYGFWFN